MIGKFFEKIFGTRNDREIKKYQKRVNEINALEESISKLSDDELKAKFLELQSAVLNGEKSLDDVLVESFAITREASSRTLNMRHYDVQLIGGMILHEGKIAEMKTGEGKTLVATLPIVLNAMTKKGVHLITVNDYLAKRDANIMKPLYEFLGFSVGVVNSGEYDDSVRKSAYDADITYGTNNEFGFDYLRDNMKYSLKEKVQREHHFAIVDEVDSILIDEARTPLIISGPTNRKLEHYSLSNGVAKELVRATNTLPTGEIDPKSGDFIVDEKSRTVILTEVGIEKAEKLFNVDNLYSLENAILSHHLDQALKANYLFEKDKDYVVRDGEVIIVDEFTGRLSEGRRFSEGLHQAIEAKENVKIKEESQTLADITFQNYFRMYEKLAGMTGTAQTEATEFSQIYNLDVLSVPTHVPVVRDDRNDLIYKTEKEKFDAVVKRIKELNQKGQPVLVGTASIERSEKLHEILKKEKIAHSVLNAKNHEKEAEIIAQAGQKGAVTIATNMAGRGVDIKLGEGVKELGGLCIIGTERHESRRIDNQLRGRSGRQGDPGVSQFYLSLEDNLLRIFGSDRIKVIMDRLGIEEGEHIESKMVTRAVENAQKKVESMHFESRKHLLEFDDVANEQRKVIYKYRNELLTPNFDITSKIDSNRVEVVEELLSESEILELSSKDDFNLEKLSHLVRENLYLELNIEDLKELEFNDLKQKVIEISKNSYEEKFKNISAEQRNEIERIIYLQVLDGAWRDHLYQMDVLKAGISLRSYNQKDPLVEYKKESYNLFMELVKRIKHDTIETLSAIRFKSEAEQQEQARFEKLARQLESEQNRNLKYNNQESNEIVINKKANRNDPCPCGSGLKYKNCCGKSGPKKGLVANV